MERGEEVGEGQWRSDKEEVGEGEGWPNRQVVWTPDT